MGHTISHYRTTKNLAQGPLGQPYRHYHTKLNRDVSLDIQPQPPAQNSQRIARFEREAQLLASLNHVNIAQFPGLQETGTPYYQLEI